VFALCCTHIPHTGSSDQATPEPDQQPYARQRRAVRARLHDPEQGPLTQIGFALARVLVVGRSGWASSIARYGSSGLHPAANRFRYLRAGWGLRVKLISIHGLPVDAIFGLFQSALIESRSDATRRVDLTRAVEALAGCAAVAISGPAGEVEHPLVVTRSSKRRARMIGRLLLPSDAPRVVDRVGVRAR
jgi:hypothetical protein